jgi:hypothetical protein
MAIVANNNFYNYTAGSWLSTTSASGADVLGGATLMLIQQTSGASFSQSTALSDVVGAEASYPGYSRQSISWDGVYSFADGSYGLLASENIFTGTSATSAAQQIAGYAVLGAQVGTPILYMEQFPYGQNVSINDGTSVVGIGLNVQIGSQGVYGAANIRN